MATFTFLDSKSTAANDCSHEIKRHLQGKLCQHSFPYAKPRKGIKKQRHHFSDKGPYSQSYVFSSTHIQM